MEYRKMENLNVSPSLLGFGCMRFPCRPDGSIDEAAAAAMIDRAMQAGITYYDTAVPYHSGRSEVFLGRLLQRYRRTSYYLATKLPVWDVKTREDAARIFEEQLSRLKTEYIDFYLLHSMTADRWHKLKELGVPELFEEYRRQGKIRFFGFSFHDSYDAFVEILNDYPWDFCQIQLNYMDTDYQAGVQGAALASRKGIPVVIMEPVKGGNLATLPAELMGELNGLDPTASPARWALRWIGSQRGIKVILSGMSDMSQLEDNLGTFEPFKPLNTEEYQAISRLRDVLHTRVRNGCTGCKYCMPCPFGVSIPENFRIWNEFGIFESEYAARRQYRMMDEGERASACRQCGQCETHCPQHIPIREHLKLAAENLGQLL